MDLKLRKSGGKGIPVYIERFLYRIDKDKFLNELLIFFSIISFAGWSDDIGGWWLVVVDA